MCRLQPMWCAVYSLTNADLIVEPRVTCRSVVVKNGGAIYNTEGATVVFTDKAAVTFDDCYGVRATGNLQDVDLFSPSGCIWLLSEAGISSPFSYSRQLPAAIGFTRCVHSRSCFRICALSRRYFRTPPPKWCRQYNSRSKEPTPILKHSLWSPSVLAAREQVGTNYVSLYVGSMQGVLEHGVMIVCSLISCQRLGGAVFNAGTFTFSGPAHFADSASGTAAVYNTATGTMR